MSDFTLNITIPDDKVTVMVAAMNWQYGQIEDPPGSGTYRDRTAGELKVFINAQTIQALKDIFTRYERYLHTQEPIPSPPDIT